MKKISFPRLLQHSLPAVCALAFMLTLLIGFIGYSTSKKITGVITRQFNDQQLILVRKISDHVQNQISHLETSLLELKEIGELENLPVMTKMLSQHQKLLSGDVLAILILDEQGKILKKTLGADWNPPASPLPDSQSLHFYQEASLVQNQVWIGTTSFWEGKWILPMGTPLPKKGTGEKQNKGAVFFIIDAVRIAQRATQGVISGTTGYAWIINPEGFLLDHPEINFIGKSIFWVLKTTSPQLSVDKIDNLIRNEFLQKKEGTSTYVLGWHRSRKTATEKLVAYTSIPFYKTPDRNLSPHPILASEFWSVALVAPIEEVSGMVRSLNFQQALLIGICQLCIIIVTGLWIFIAYRWSGYLKIEVDNKTEELQKSQEKLIQSERLAAVGSMAGHISHEIKNPLIAIGGLAGQLKRSPVQSEKEKDKLDLITTEISRLEKILVDVQDFTRPTTPHKIKSQINRMVTDLIQLFSPMFASQQIKVQIDLDQGLPEFFFDPEQIKQVFLNLTKNAVEAMPEGGTLSLHTERDRNSVLIRISDTGKGIDSQIKEQLFQPFVTNKKKGTGLGLAVSYKLVQDHNGDIRVDSSEQGTTMTVVLPLEAA
ncbi:MAG: ATP-binding protein [Thermodesulfobacteriota bacterium]|jgi:signal transduction histidine kinase